MMSIPVLLAVAGAMLLVILVLALRSRGRKRISPAIATRLIELVSAGDEAAALNMIRGAGYDETEARRILALTVRVEDYGRPGPDKG